MKWKLYDYLAFLIEDRYTNIDIYNFLMKGSKFFSVKGRRRRFWSGFEDLGYPWGIYIRNPMNVTFLLPLWGFLKCYLHGASPKCFLFWVSPREIKGFSGQAVTAAGIFFCGLWIPYGYSKFSDSLQNRRLLPLALACHLAS